MGFIPENWKLEAIEVKHSDFELWDPEHSAFKVKCRWCKGGIFALRRDFVTGRLLAEDNCLNCGRPVIWSDVETIGKTHDPKSRP